MGTLQQISAVTLLNVRSLPQRLAASIVLVIGVAGVVGVLVTVLAMAKGLNRTFVTTGDPDRAIVLHKAATTEGFSSIDIGWVGTIANAPGVLHSADGTPAVCPERIVGAVLPLRSDGDQANVTLRDTCPATFLVHPEWRIVAGRMFHPGLHEVVVGSAAASEFSGIGIGRRVRFGGTQWTVVGRFTSGGDSHESEVLTDARTLMSAFGWSAFSSVTVRHASPSPRRCDQSELQRYGAMLHRGRRILDSGFGRGLRDRVAILQRSARRRARQLDRARRDPACGADRNSLGGHHRARGRHRRGRERDATARGAGAPRSLLTR